MLICHSFPQVTEHPHISQVPEAAGGCIAAGPCFELFFQAAINNSIPIDPTFVALIPNITAEQLSAFCPIKNAWDQCIDETAARTECSKDASIKMINDTIILMCREPNFHGMQKICSKIN